jgi:hypothetical protein
LKDWYSSFQNKEYALIFAPIFLFPVKIINKMSPKSFMRDIPVEPW